MTRRMRREKHLTLKVLIMSSRHFATLEERLDFIEFRQELLLYAIEDHFSRDLFEYELTEGEYEALNELVEDINTKVDNGEKIDGAYYVHRIMEIVPFIDEPQDFLYFLAEDDYEDDWLAAYHAIYDDEEEDEETDA